MKKKKKEKLSGGVTSNTLPSFENIRVWKEDFA